ncbi:hypothetical protein ACJJTC_006826 [Scirpophaga incertulas]
MVTEQDAKEKKLSAPNKKSHAARYNTAPPFTANKILTLLHKTGDQVTAQEWKKVVDKTKIIIQEDYNRRIGEIDQELIINLQNTSSESESDSDYDDDLGCVPFTE